MRSKFVAVITVLALSSITAVAQYGGGTGGTGTGTGSGGTTYTPRSYGSKAAIIGGVAGGAALAGGLLLWRAHRRATVVGCVGSGGNTLVSEKDSRTYTLRPGKGVDLKPGDRVEVSGKKIGKDADLALQVDHLRQDFGSCKEQASLTR